MKRVKKDSLNVVDGKHYLAGDLFTGVVYSIVDNVVDNIFYLESGCISSKRYDLFGFEQYSLAIDSSNFDEELDEEPFIYKGSKFTGVAYSFNDGFCVSAHSYEDGCIKKEVSWLESGVLGFYEGYHDGLGEFSTWYENGKRNKVKAFGSENFRLEADFNHAGELRRLSIFGSFRAYLLSVADKVYFPLVRELEGLKELKLASSLYLSGNGINDDVFSLLVKSIHFSNICKLHLSMTSLDEKNIAMLKASDSPKELILDDD